MSETENISLRPSENKPVFKAILSEEKMPPKIKEEVVGAMEIINLFGNMVQLFTANFGYTVVTMLTDSNMNQENDKDDSQALSSKMRIPLR